MKDKNKELEEQVSKISFGAGDNDSESSDDDFDRKYNYTDSIYDFDFYAILHLQYKRIYHIYSNNILFVVINVKDCSDMLTIFVYYQHKLINAVVGVLNENIFMGRKQKNCTAVSETEDNYEQKISNFQKNYCSDCLCCSNMLCRCILQYRRCWSVFHDCQCRRNCCTADGRRLSV